jgi:hypothetical protein
VTEVEWLGCTDPAPMLGFIRGKVSDRKLRLFACACCRCLWHLLDKRVRKVVKISELLADKFAGQRELDESWQAAGRAGCKSPPAEWGSRQLNLHYLAWGAARAAMCGSGEGLQGLIGESTAAAREATLLAGAPFQTCQLLRCLLGPVLFRPVALDRAWLMPDVAALAGAIYDERSFDRLAILAGSLEEAGCSNPDILGHCRSDREHARGCWVLDLLLSRERKMM